MVSSSTGTAGQQPLKTCTVRLRFTLWHVTVLALILGVMGGVVRFKV